MRPSAIHVSSCASSCIRTNPLDGRGQPVVSLPGDGYERFGVQRAGVTLAEVLRPVGDAARRALLPGLVAAARLAIEMARLRVELRRRLDEVEASRARIVAVADEERRRIERDLHDGAQQRLVSIGLALRHAQHALGPPTAKRAAGRGCWVCHRARASSPA